MRIICALRNPFDIISTKLNYALTNREEYHSKKLASTAVRKLKVADSILTRETNYFLIILEQLLNPRMICLREGMY